MTKASLLLAFSFLFFTATQAAQPALSPANEGTATPFTDVAFDAAPSVKVTVAGEEFYLFAVNGVARADIMQACEAAYGAQCDCMLAERFSEMMTKIGQPVGATIDLRLYQFTSHQVVMKAGYPVSTANFDEIKTNRELRNELCFP